MAGAKAGPNFAGHLSLVTIGCGAGCVFVPVVDVQTGRVFKNSPLGGEDQSSLDMKYQVDSRLIATRYISNERCKSRGDRLDRQCNSREAPSGTWASKRYAGRRTKLPPPSAARGFTCSAPPRSAHGAGERPISPA